MAPVKQLGEVSWLVVCAACCLMSLVFAVMHLYDLYKFFYCFCPFLFYTFKKSGIDKLMEWSTITACPSLVYFFTGVIPKGLILQNFVFDVCVCFM